MLQICPNLTDQHFEKNYHFEEKFSRFSRWIWSQWWRSKGYDSLRLSQAQILWGMYHKINVDYAYLLWEDFVYQDSSIPRRNRVNWHFARDDPMFTMIKIPNPTKEYYAIASGAEPPKTKASVKKKQTRSDKTKTPTTAKGKRLKTSAKAAKPAKKKQPTKMSKAKGLTVLSKVALTEAEQMELATKRRLIQTHSFHANGSGTNEGTGDKPWVPDVPTYAFDDGQISWKSSDEEYDDEVVMSGDDDDDADNQDDDDNDDDDQNDDNDDDDDGQDHESQDDDNEQTDSDNDGDDFVHPKFSIKMKEG
ncbi:hypothetical protein Tco_0792115 [Tanacetum coccineum]